MKERTKIKDLGNAKSRDHGTISKPHTAGYKIHCFFVGRQSAWMTILTIGMVLSLFMLPIFSIFAEDTTQKQVSTQHEWVGEKIVFLPDYLFDYQVCYYRSRTDINPFCWCPSQGPENCPSKEQLAGKTAEIVRIEKKFFVSQFLYTIVLRLEESGTLLYSTHLSLTLPRCTTLLSYMEKGKNYIGKTVWSKQTRFLGSTEYAVIPYVRNLEKLTVVDVRWGPFSDCPLEFYLKKSNGEIGWWDGGPIKENVLFNQVFDQVFDEEWYLTDPRKLHPNWRPRVWRAIEKREVYIGMTKEMVLMSWGRPKDVNRSIGIWGVHEQWVYDSQYLYFENDKLTTIQD